MTATRQGVCQDPEWLEQCHRLLTFGLDMAAACRAAYPTAARAPHDLVFALDVVMEHNDELLSRGQSDEETVSFREDDLAPYRAAVQVLAEKLDRYSITPAARGTP